jgi:hypothetical protein
MVAKLCFILIPLNQVSSAYGYGRISTYSSRWSDRSYCFSPLGYLAVANSEVGQIFNLRGGAVHRVMPVVTLYSQKGLPRLTSDATWAATGCLRFQLANRDHPGRASWCPQLSLTPYRCLASYRLKHLMTSVLPQDHLLHSIFLE